MRIIVRLLMQICDAVIVVASFAVDLVFLGGFPVGLISAAAIYLHAVHSSSASISFPDVVAFLLFLEIFLHAGIIVSSLIYFLDTVIAFFILIFLHAFITLAFPDGTSFLLILEIFLHTGRVHAASQSRVLVSVSLRLSRWFGLPRRNIRRRRTESCRHRRRSPVVAHRPRCRRFVTLLARRLSVALLAPHPPVCPPYYNCW